MKAILHESIPTRNYSATEPELVYVVGCIDWQGSIHYRCIWQGHNPLHTINEKRGKTWRWNVPEQKFVTTDLTDEETALVVDFLERKGYKRSI